MAVISLLTAYEFRLILYVTVLMAMTFAAVTLILQRRTELRATWQGLKQNGIPSLRQAVPAWIRPRIPQLMATILAVTISILCIINLHGLLTMKPRIVRTTPSNLETIRDYEEPIIFEFSAPVDLRKLSVNTFPKLDGEWQMSGYFGFLPFGRRVIFRPGTSYPPDTRIMLYLSNISKPFSGAFGSEYLLEVHSPSTPEVATVDPPEHAAEVPIDSPVTFTLDTPDSPGFTWDTVIDPQVPVSIARSLNKTLTIRFSDALRQATTYTVRLYLTAGTYDTRSKKIVDMGEKQLVKTLIFTTVKAPLIKSFSPEGNGILPGTPIVITFDQPMLRQTVESNLRISPEATGSMEWSSDSTVLTVHPENLQMDTRYRISLTQGALTVHGGILKNDVAFEYATIGPVAATIIPGNTATNVPVDSPIRIAFDQNVDHTSAESHLKITPHVTGSFSWDGVTMSFTPTTPMTYLTSYTVSVDSGVKSIQGLPSDQTVESNFTTSPERFVLDVPMYRQQESFTCNIAAARMLLAYRGVIKSESELKAGAGTSGSRGNGNPHLGYTANYGTYWEPIAKMIHTYRPYRLFTDWTLPPLIAEIKKGNPVMIWGQNGWSDPHEISWDTSDGTHIYAINGMHSYVVKGFVGTPDNPTSIIVNDPWRGVWTLSTAEFLRRWRFFNVALTVD